MTAKIKPQHDELSFLGINFRPTTGGVRWSLPVWRESAALAADVERAARLKRETERRAAIARQPSKKVRRFLRAFDRFLDWKMPGT